MPKAIKTVQECIDRIDGVAAVYQYTGCQRTAVYNWVAANQFPANYKDAISGLLVMQGGRHCVAADALFPMVKLVDVPRTRGAHGRFIAPTPQLTLVPKSPSPDMWAKLEAWEKGPMTKPLDYGWTGSDGSPVPAEMQIALTKDFIAQQRGQY